MPGDPLAEVAVCARVENTITLSYYWVPADVVRLWPVVAPWPVAARRTVALALAIDIAWFSIQRQAADRTVAAFSSPSFPLPAPSGGHHAWSVAAAGAAGDLLARV